MDETRSAVGLPATSAPEGSLLKSTANAETLPPGLPAGKPPEYLQVPGYEILSELGRGGMGVVYKARHLKLNRVVALKMILAGSHAGAAQLARFQTEAEAIARLQHPNIVQVHEVGEHEGKPFFSLEFCGGGSLAQKLNGTPLPAPVAAARVETLARAMQAAHDQHIIHRDLKPANVLLTEDGTPKITDFGLAKKMDEAGQTQEGAIMGTPSYMAPEQASGKSHEIGPLADVYTLGAILYECLTGRPPFKAATVMDTILQVVKDEPVPPSQLQSRTPRDLETICLKCLRKETRKRYGSARELADDLRRFLAGEPIVARPVGWLERGLKWVQRKPALAALSAALLLLTAVSFAVFVGLWLNAEDKRQKADEAKTKEAKQRQLADSASEQSKKDAQAARQAEIVAEEREQEARHQLANSNILLSQAAWLNNDVRRAREWLDKVPLEPYLPHGWEWHYLKRQFEGGIFTLQAQAGPTQSVAFSPDGLRLATAHNDKTARLWDARTGEQLLQFKGHTGWVTSVAFSPDGTRLATTSNDLTARLWDVRTGKQLLLFKGHNNAVLSVAFSPDGQRLATAGDNTARLWDARTGEQLLQFKGHTNGVQGVAFSPDGTQVATASQDGTARLWDARRGEPLLQFKGHTGVVAGVAFSPDGTRLATAGADQTARLWDLRTGQQLLQLQGHTNGVRSVAFSPDGTWLATASVDQTTCLWNARSGQQVLQLRGHTSSVTRVAFSPDGLRLATASWDQTARLWDIRSGQPFLPFQGHTQAVTSVAFSPDGLRLATGSADRTARLWDAHTGQELLQFKGHTQGVTSVAFSPDGSRLATASADKTARLWNARTGELLLELQGHTGTVQSVAFSPDGSQLATASHDQTARLWDTHTGEQLREFRGHKSYVYSVTFRHDGAQLATTSYDGTARLWDAHTGEPLLEIKANAGTIHGVAFDPDGRRIATANRDLSVRLWDARTGQQLLLLQGHTGSVDSIRFSPDGTRLATASADQTARLWDAHTGQPLLVLTGHTKAVTGVAFSADGTRLVTASADQTARLWDARPIQQPLEADERPCRLWATRGDPAWHEEQFKQHQVTDRFAAAFHLERLLAYRPELRSTLLRQRTVFLEATVKQNDKDAAARLLLARTAWHSPTLGIKDPESLLPAADDKQPFAQRTRGGLLLRLKKADEAVPVLEAALKERGDDQPPVEELLLAWAYLDTDQTDKAKEQWTTATAWLDRQQEAVRAANIVGTLPGGVLPGVAPLFAPPADPRYNVFDWETWHELDVLRRELSPRFVAMKP